MKGGGGGGWGWEVVQFGKCCRGGCRRCFSFVPRFFLGRLFLKSMNSLKGELVSSPFTKCNFLKITFFGYLHVQYPLNFGDWWVWQMLPWRLPPLFQFRALVLSWWLFLKSTNAYTSNKYGGCSRCFSFIHREYLGWLFLQSSIARCSVLLWSIRPFYYTDRCAFYVTRAAGTKTALTRKTNLAVAVAAVFSVSCPGSFFADFSLIWGVGTTLETIVPVSERFTVWFTVFQWRGSSERSHVAN